MDIKTTDRLVQLRKAHGLSQEALGEKLGVSRQAISKWERGESSPDTDNLIALAKLYGITLDELISGTDATESRAVNSHGKKGDFTPDDVRKLVPRSAENEKELYPGRADKLFKFPFAIVVAAVYVVINLIFGLWSPLWIMFLLIPAYYQYAFSCRAKSRKKHLLLLPVPEAVLCIYFVLGYAFGIWGAGAAVFIADAIYYWAVVFYAEK